MVFCAPRCGCEHCYLVRVYQHPRFTNQMKNMVEIYKRMVDPDYFPIEVVQDTLQRSRL